MSNECILDVAVAIPTTIAVGVSSSVIAVAITSPTTITVATTSTVVAVAITSPTTIGVAVTSTAINVAVIQPFEIEVAVLDMGTVASALLNSIEEGAMRDRQDAKKLAASTAVVSVHATPGVNVELPTGLVLYPSFRGDTGYIEMSVSASHQNMAGQTVTFELWAVPGTGVPFNMTVGTFVSPAFAAGAGALNLEFNLRLKARAFNFQVMFAYLSWRDGAGVDNYLPYPRKPTAFANFGDVLNGDNGDVQLRLECQISGLNAGTLFNINNTTYVQYAGRSGA